MHEYGISFVPFESIRDMDAVILAVAHDQFKGLTLADVSRLYNRGKKVMLDIKGLLDREEYENADYIYWRL
jgi:UDP-N-acetyl-D-galactosamine dehydrogenase